MCSGGGRLSAKALIRHRDFVVTNCTKPEVSCKSVRQNVQQHTGGKKYNSFVLKR